ncbi:MAG: c-type cytochrome [Anaerolineales bacterium]
MKTRLISVVIIVGALVILCSGLASAGGWSAVKLESLPRTIAAGEPVTFAYTVLQHGNKPVSNLETKVYATHTESGESLAVNGQAMNYPDAGVYAAEVVFPLAGQWQWSIEAFEGKHPMPPLEISSVGMVPASASSQPIWIVAATVLVAGGITIISWRRKARLWAGLAIPVLVLGVGASIFFSPSIENPAVAAGSDMYTSDADYGEALFLAKGCASCHVHQGNRYTDIQDSYGYIGAYNTGPDLSDFQADADYLAKWLRSPKSIRPNTSMPDLGLSEQEISALIAFLNKE